MSLINDALKRAMQSDKKQPPPDHEGTYGSMYPVLEKRKAPFPWALVGVIVIALALSAFLFAKWWNGSHSARGNNPSSVASNPNPKPRPAPAPAPVAAKPPATAPVQPIVTNTPEPAPVAVAPTPAPVVSNPAPAQPPIADLIPAAPVRWPADLKLMGIFYSKINPHALISGKTVAEGDEINGIRISKIEPNDVILEWKGQTKTLYAD